MPRDAKAIGLLGAIAKWKNAPPLRDRFFANVKVGKPSDCWPWLGALFKKTGYGKRKFRGKTWTAHRVAWTVTKGEIPPSKKVLHRCDYRACCNPGHLFLGSQKINMQDAASKGRLMRGNRHTNAKLSDAKVRRIRNKHIRGVTGRELAAEFGVHERTIWRVLHGQWWKHAG